MKSSPHSARAGWAKSIVGGFGARPAILQFVTTKIHHTSPAQEVNRRIAGPAPDVMTIPASDVTRIAGLQSWRPMSVSVDENAEVLESPVTIMRELRSAKGRMLRAIGKSEQ